LRPAHPRGFSDRLARLLGRGLRRRRNPRSVSICKVGVTGLTNNLVGEVAPSGIPVVCVLALPSARWMRRRTHP
jgi:hypothetical protein